MDNIKILNLELSEEIADEQARKIKITSKDREELKNVVLAILKEEKARLEEELSNEETRLTELKAELEAQKEKMQEESAANKEMNFFGIHTSEDKEEESNMFETEPEEEIASVQPEEIDFFGLHSKKEEELEEKLPEDEIEAEPEPVEEEPYMEKEVEDDKEEEIVPFAFQNDISEEAMQRIKDLDSKYYKGQYNKDLSKALENKSPEVEKEASIDDLKSELDKESFHPKTIEYKNQTKADIESKENTIFEREQKRNELKRSIKNIGDAITWLESDSVEIPEELLEKFEIQNYKEQIKQEEELQEKIHEEQTPHVNMTDRINKEDVTKLLTALSESKIESEQSAFTAIGLVYNEHKDEYDALKKQFEESEQRVSEYEKYNKQQLGEFKEKLSLTEKEEEKINDEIQSLKDDMKTYVEETLPIIKELNEEDLEVRKHGGAIEKLTEKNKRISDAGPSVGVVEKNLSVFDEIRIDDKPQVVKGVVEGLKEEKSLGKAS